MQTPTLPSPPFLPFTATRDRTGRTRSRVSGHVRQIRKEGVERHSPFHFPVFAAETGSVRPRPRGNAGTACGCAATRCERHSQRTGSENSRRCRNESFLCRLLNVLCLQPGWRRILIVGFQSDARHRLFATVETDNVLTAHGAEIGHHVGEGGA
jgi:hypothetical protein